MCVYVCVRACVRVCVCVCVCPFWVMKNYSCEMKPVMGRTYYQYKDGYGFSNETCQSNAVFAVQFIVIAL